VAKATARPTKVQLDRPGRRLVVEWADGFRTSYPWSFLRAKCPSAGETTAREVSNPLAVLGKIPSAELVDVRMVGAYAINLTWADGHSAGIYTWDYLQTLAESDEVATTAIA
jgi:DUF971 family protein